MLRTWLAINGLISISRAYIPAQPTNDTTLISLSNDFIQLSWQVLGSSAQGVFRDSVSRQLVANNSTQTGTSYAARGALVHFSEDNNTQTAASPPWVAFIQCDFNTTNAPQDNDVFTEVRDHGAVAALLYSLTGSACLINQEYITDFDQPIDVYSTTNLQAARLINSQFDNVGTNAYWYSSSSLNASESSIYAQLNSTLSILSSAQPPPPLTTVTSATNATGSDADDDPISPTTFLYSDVPETDSDMPTTVSSETTSEETHAAENNANTLLQKPTHARRQQTSSTTSSATSTATSGAAYLIAVLANQQAIFSNSTGNGTNPNGDSQGAGTGGANVTGLAMIILYAITGCVTVMFLIVIISGAIKAVRHPERYGPRAGIGPGRRGAQTRARGITRAILDTFPVVKFGKDEEDTTQQPQAKDEEIALDDVHPHHHPPTMAAVGSIPVVSKDVDIQPRDMEAIPAEPLLSTVTSPVVPASTDSIDPNDVNNRQTCPICVEDFEDGQDLRILPCDGRHRFHRDCIDPWLLDVSSLCPLCRLDLGGPDATVEDELTEEPEEVLETSLAARTRRFLYATHDAISGSHLVGDVAPRRRRETTTSTTGSGFTQSRFYRYVQQRRNHAHGRRSGSTTAPPQP